MKPFTAACIFVLSVIFAGLGGTGLQTISLKEVLVRTLAHNIDIERATRNRNAARFDLLAAKSAFLPLVRSQSAYTKSSTGHKDPITTDQLNAALSVDLVLFDGLYSVKTFQKAKLSWMAAASAEQLKKEEIIYSVVLKYLQVYCYGEIAGLEDENVKDQQNLLKKIDSFKKAGQKPIGDWLTQKAITAAAESRSTNAVHDFELSKLQLVQLSGDSSFSGDFLLRKPVFDSVRIADLLQPDSLVAKIVTTRKDIQALNYTVKASELQIAIEKSARWPLFSATYQTGSGYSSQYENVLFKEQFKDLGINNTFGLNLSFPIFDRFSTRHAVLKAKLQSEQSKADLRELQRQVFYEINQALLLYRTSCGQMQSIFVELESAQLALSAAQIRYDAGSLTLSELTSSQTLYASAQGENVLAVYRMIQAMVGVVYAAGLIDTIIDYISG